MQKDYYINILYPIQDRILRLLEVRRVDFYLTGGTALSRAHLFHRYSDDLDFFSNRNEHFRNQVQMVLEVFIREFSSVQVPVADERFVRCFVFDKQNSYPLNIRLTLGADRMF